MFVIKIRPLKNILFILVLAFLFFSCKKEEKDASITPTHENLVGTYKITAATLAAGGSMIDVYNNEAYVKACQRDDIYQLNADNSLIVIDTGLVCSPTNDLVSTWSLINYFQIKLDGKIYTINYWDGKKLVGDYLDNGLKATVTYTRQ